MTETTFGIWDGITESKLLGKRNTRQRLGVFEAAKSKQWAKMLDLIKNLPRVSLEGSYSPTQIAKLRSEIVCGLSSLTQVIEPESSLQNTLLHYAAHHNANTEVIQQLIEQGASRTRRNAQGLTALDIASQQDHTHLYDLLEPQLKRTIPSITLRHLDQHFYNVLVDSWGHHLLKNYSPQFPQVDALLETNDAFMCFPIFASLCGVAYWLTHEDAENVLYAHEVCGMGCEAIYRITSAGPSTIAECDDTLEYYPKGHLPPHTRSWDLGWWEFIN